MIILGVDPGTRVSGYGVIRTEGNRFSHVENGCIAPSPTAAMSIRLTAIFNRLEEIIVSFAPDRVVVEKVFFAKNAASALKLGQCRGVVLAVAGRHDVPVYEYSPTQIKQAVTGYGRADKQQVQQMVRMILGLPEIAQEDASDALAVALCHAQSYPLVEKLAS